MIETELVERIKSLGFPQLAGLTNLTQFDGSFLNLDTRLPGGARVRLLDDAKRYWAAEVEPAGEDKCWGVAADESQIVIYRYGVGGADAELVACVAWPTAPAPTAAEPVSAPPVAATYWSYDPDDIGFFNDQHWFRYRAAAIIIHDGQVLMCGNERDDFLYSVGGAVHFGESSEQTVVREVFEETGLQLDIDRLAFVHENFYTAQGVAENVATGKLAHELAFYYLMRPPADWAVHADSATMNGFHEYLTWVPIADFAQYKAFPAFFADYLPGLLDSAGSVDPARLNTLPQHVVTRED